MKGFKNTPSGGSGQPSIRVTIQQPKENNPYLGGGGNGGQGRKRNPSGDDLTGLWFLGALFGAAWLLTKFKGSGQIGNLQRAGAGIRGTNLMGKAVSIGDIARFKITDDNADTVRNVIQSYLTVARSDPWLRASAERLLAEYNLGPESDAGSKVKAFQDLVNNRMAVIPDPEGFERIISPDELLNRWLDAREKGEDASKIGDDCDSKALLLASLLIITGVPAHVMLFDVNGDGIYDHAAVIANVSGQAVYLETVVPGMQPGDRPEILGKKSLVI